MAVLTPARFADLVTRLFLEPTRQDALFELPRRRWYLPTPGGPDVSVQFHGQRAGAALGPAAGPHTQMAQNCLLSYVAGGRILELKTVQVNDHLTISRPCIDMTNVGYNVEWSQELLVEQSLHEYVASAMLIAMFRASVEHSRGLLSGPAGDVIHDISVGYDLEGIRSEKIRRFLAGMRDATTTVNTLRGLIPNRFKAARDLPFETRLSRSITLSTFHNCPAVEIEKITEFLMGDCDFDVIVKMNPPTLGREKLEHLLHDVMGYQELKVNPSAYDASISLAESVQLCARLSHFAAQRGRRVGFKFSNTLEVINERNFFQPAEKIMYLSGQPLHVITMALTDEFRRAVGPDVPISFSAGIDQHNYPIAVACGFVPVTVSTDLLRPGGYGRFPAYLARLQAEMQQVGAADVEAFILKRFGTEPEARRIEGPQADPDHVVRRAAWLNTSIAARQAREDPRYHAVRNRGVPKRVDSQLATFDCLTCDKCLPVCPNAANFTYPTPQISFDCHDLIITPDGRWRPGANRRFEIQESIQIACYADFCNECGNCDTFCPEYGGPYIKKPVFYGSAESWESAAPRDGFVVGPDWIRGRIKGVSHELRFRGAATQFASGRITVLLDAKTHSYVASEVLDRDAGDQTVDMWVYHTLRHLHQGVLDAGCLNQVNASAANE
ncbi:MAG: glutamate synthase [Phycisphaerae bacterium]